METANAGAWEFGGVGMAHVHNLLARCDARVAVSDRDWSPGPGDTHVRDIPGGTLVRAWNGKWGLHWLGPAGEFASLSAGTLGEVEDAAHEVVLFGLPGGICPDAAPRDWSLEEGSLHKVRTGPTMRGTYRIMTYPGGRGTLEFVRDDYRVVHLGAGDLDELKATADERLARRHGEILRVRCFGKMYELFGVGLHGAVGQVELLHRSTRLVLVQAGFDQFELHHAALTGECEVVGRYRGADLERGNLGEIRISGPLQQGAHRTDSMDVVPRRSSPHQGRAERCARTTATGPRQAQPLLPSSEDMLRLANCLEWKPSSGNGKSELANVYAAFRELVGKGLGNLLLWVKEWRDLLESRTQVRFGPCHRTFTRALALFLKITGLGRKEGRRFRVFLGDLRRGDAEVWATIRERFPPLLQQADKASPSPPAAPPSTTSSPTPTVDDPTPNVAPTATSPAAPANMTPTSAPSCATPAATQDSPITDPPSAPVPSAGPGTARVDPWLLEAAALYHSEAGLDPQSADPTGGHRPASYLRDEDRWRPYCDRSWTVDAPSQFPGRGGGVTGEARGPPKKDPPKR